MRKRIYGLMVMSLLLIAAVLAFASAIRARAIADRLVGPEIARYHHSTRFVLRPDRAISASYTFRASPGWVISYVGGDGSLASANYITLFGEVRAGGIPVGIPVVDAYHDYLRREVEDFNGRVMEAGRLLSIGSTYVAVTNVLGTPVWCRTNDAGIVIANYSYMPPRVRSGTLTGGWQVLFSDGVLIEKSPIHGKIR